MAQENAAQKIGIEITASEGPGILHQLTGVIASHHGEKEFGSPVEPRTPEAMTLHYIDNLDARLEMFAAGYTTAKPLAPRIFERVWPLPGNLVTSLQKFQVSVTPAKSDEELF